MKKKYFAPEMEEVELDEVVVLDDVIDPSKVDTVECPPVGEEA